jgi:UDP-glucose 4-epimerase
LRTLVTGGAGFIGSHVAECLLAKGHQVVIVDNLSTGNKENLPRGATFHHLDICQTEFAGLILDYKPEVIVHLAAQIDVRKSVANPVEDADINVLGTIRLAQAASEVGTKKIVFSSTGGAIYGEQDVFPADEQHPCRPVSAYGTSKLCAEKFLEYFSRSGGPSCVSLRYSNVYGPRQDPLGEAGVVAIFIRSMLAKEQPVIYGDGKQTRDFIYVKDVAQANLLAVESLVEGVYNIGSGQELTINALAEMLAKQTGFDGRIEYGPRKPGEQLRSVIDSSLAQRSLDWKACVPLEKGIEETVDYFKSRVDWDKINDE